MKKRKKDATVYPDPTRWISEVEYDRRRLAFLKEEFEKIRGQTGAPDSFSTYMWWSMDKSKEFKRDLYLGGTAVDNRRSATLDTQQSPD